MCKADFERLLARLAVNDTGLVGDQPEVIIAEADQLNYVADLISELKDMSQSLGAGTLSEILSLAHAEAQQELHRGRR